RALDEPYDLQRALSDCGVEVRVALRLRQQLGSGPCGSGHLEIEAGADARARTVRAAPITHDEAPERPLAPQDLVAEPDVLAAEDAGQAVVAGHDRPRSGFLDHHLERPEIELSERALGDLAADGVALELRFVSHEVLRRRTDALRLHAADECDRQTP